MRPSCVAGVQLRPYSLFHDYALREIGSPYYNGGTGDTSDLIRALIVCTLSVRDRLLPLERALNSSRRGWAWALRILLHGRRRTEQQLLEHIDAYCKMPEYYVKIDRSVRKFDMYSGAPAHWHTAVVLSEHINGVAWPDVWDMPWCMAACMKLILDEREPNGPRIRGEQFKAADNA